MHTAKTITHILLPIFIGCIIGGAVSGLTVMLVLGIILLVIDVIVGIALQYKIENPPFQDEWNSLSFEEKRARARAMVEEAKQELKDEGIDLDEEMRKFADEFEKKRH